MPSAAAIAELGKSGSLRAFRFHASGQFLALRSMKRPAVRLLISALLLTLILALETTMRTNSQTLPVIFAEDSVSEVKTIVRQRLYVGYPHLKGWYLDCGSTVISFKDGMGAEFTFTRGEELDLVGLHSEGGNFYLILIAEYKPERGFLIFKSHGGRFSETTLAELPHGMAFANVGSKGMTAKQYFSIRPLPSQPSNDFYETTTAWLWSQMVTGEAILSQGLNNSAVDDCWKKWSSAIAGKLEPVR